MLTGKNDIVPLFSTSASLSDGGIFTCEKAGSTMKGKNPRPNAPKSICDIAKEGNFEKIVLVESNFVNFMLAYKNLCDMGCQMIFGLKMVVCDDLSVKSDESLKTNSKIIIFMKNDAAYKDIIKIYSKAATDGFYYTPRIDWQTLEKLWTDNLTLSLPFYSSFLSRNLLTFSPIVPKLPCKPVLFKEVGQNNVLDLILEPAVDLFAKENECEIQKVKSIYYYKRSDARKFMMWRCILNRTTWDKPNMDFMCSQEFCYEAYKELIK